jgi:hypothetical protein
METCEGRSGGVIRKEWWWRGDKEGVVVVAW